MRELNEIKNQILSSLTKKGVTKGAFSVKEQQKTELSFEETRFTLMRTLFDNSVTATVFCGTKKGQASGNDLSPEAVEGVIDTAVLSAQSAPEDPYWDIAPGQGSEVFVQGTSSADMDKFYDRLHELIEDITREYPQIKIMTSYAEFVSVNKIYFNTNGTEFVNNDRFYDLTLEFSANDGEKNTGIDAVFFATDNLDTRFIDMNDVRRHLQAAVDSLKVIKPEGKFEGTIIFTPDCLNEMISFLVGNYMSDSVLIDGTSRFKDKLNCKVASDKFTLAAHPFDKRIVIGERYTFDGFKSESVTFIENGVLTQFPIGLYAANKCSLPVSKNSFGNIYIEPGKEKIDDMIKGVKKGLLCGGFSGGTPSANGEISGVAKNSFLIEDGKITGAVSETMINGNLEEMFKNIEAVSEEVSTTGFSIIPYMAISGMVISGK